MIELVPEIVNNVVVLNARNVCRQSCRSCSDIGAAVHNWLLSQELRYVIIDFQDDKEICADLLVELIQLHKRLQMPFLFVGVVDKPRRILEEYMFMSFGYPVFMTPEEAGEYLFEHHPDAAQSDLSAVVVDEPLAISRSRSALRGLETETEEDQPADE